MTTYEEYMGAQGMGVSPIISVANDASWATRTFDVLWTSQVQAVDDFLGYQRVLSTGGSYPNPSGYITRITPMPLPNYLEQYLGGDQQFYLPSGGARYQMWCTKINRIQGLGNAGGAPATGTPLVPVYTTDANGMPMASYQKARMELGFESLPYDILPDSDSSVVGAGGFPDESLLTRYVTKVPGPSSDYITLNYGLMLYASGDNQGSKVPFSPGKIVVTHDLRYRWELVPKEAVPSLAVNPLLNGGPASQGGQAAIEWTLGRVNQTNFGGYVPGTLLLTAAAIIPIRGSTGRRLYTVEYFMKYFPYGHQNIYGPLTNSPTTLGWLEISVDGTSYPISPTTPDGVHVYDVADFAWLFRPPTGGTFPTN